MNIQSYAKQVNPQCNNKMYSTLHKSCFYIFKNYLATWGNVPDIMSVKKEGLDIILLKENTTQAYMHTQ